MSQEGNSGAGVRLCWSEIGVWGDRSCPEIAKVGGCISCITYRKAGRQLFQREAPAAYRAEWSRVFAQAAEEDARLKRPFLVFRLGASWLGLSVERLVEVAHPAVIRSLPHRRSEAMLGLTAVRGEILPCISLHQMLSEQAQRIERFLVTHYGAGKWVFPVDQVMGVQELPLELASAPPANLSHAEIAYTKGMLTEQGAQIGLLDEELLYGTIERRIV